MVIGDMLGVPRADADKLVDWTNRTTAFEDPRLVPDLGDVWRALEEFIPYVNAMLEERERQPSDDLQPLSSKPRWTASALPTRRC